MRCVCFSGQMYSNTQWTSAGCNIYLHSSYFIYWILEWVAYAVLAKRIQTHNEPVQAVTTIYTVHISLSEWCRCVCRSGQTFLGTMPPRLAHTLILTWANFHSHVPGCCDIAAARLEVGDGSYHVCVASEGGPWNRVIQIIHARVLVLLWGWILSIS
jgi:hypothetical protein